MKSNVTTGKGDAGKTTALDGSAFEKSHPMMEAVGTLDALRAQTAQLRLQLQEQYPGELIEINFLLFLLHTYFLIGTTISDPYIRKPEWRRGEVTKAHLDRLEEEQQRLESGLNLPHSFIVSATNTVAAQADITASAARTFERRLVAFCLSMPDVHIPVCMAFTNRLSDYFFVLARHLERGHHQPVNYGLLEEM
jgi:cob(I)alamin adenosyltransferase